MSLIFVGAKTVEHPVYGKCRAEIWRQYHDTPENEIREPDAEYKPKYLVQYYKNNQLVE